MFTLQKFTFERLRTFLIATAMTGWLSTLLFTSQVYGQCSNISTLGCADVPKALPFFLTFDGSEGGLTDANGNATGFTMVDPPSARLAVDDPVFNATVPGYEPGNLSVSGGSLVITSTKGIMFKQPITGSPNQSNNTNSQINGLGAAFEFGTSVIRLRTTISAADFTASGGGFSQQGGIWVGLNEDNYVKLVVSKVGGGTTGKVQLLVEDETSPTELNSPNITNINTKSFELILEVNPISGIAEAFYSVDGAALVAVGNLPIPPEFIAGVDHDANPATANVSYGGIFVTHRNAAAAASFDLAFEDFSISPLYRVNFQTAGLTPPAGFAIDYGKGFGTSQLDGNDYGWRELGTTTSKDISVEAAGNGTGAERNRLGTAYAGSTAQQQLEGTLIHFQGNHIGAWAAQPRGNAEHQWEFATGNGNFEVEVSVGDISSSTDSRHTAVVEGITALDVLDASVASGQVSSGRVKVQVTDGLLTVTGLGGLNSKINYIEIYPTTDAATTEVLTFSPNPLIVDVGAGGSNTENASLAASSGTPDVFMLIPPEEDELWLTIPAAPAVGANAFTVDGTSFSVGDNPTTTVVASAAGFAPAVLDVQVNITTGPEIADQTFSVDEGTANGTNIATVLATDDVAVTAYNITAGNDLGIFAINNSGELSVADNTDLTAVNGPFSLTVEVEDAGGLKADATVTILVAEPVLCSPISTLACPDVLETIPFSLDFSADAGGIEDKNGAGTGFTAVLEHSEARRAGDLPISNPNINGYEPSLLTLNTGGGQLEILSQGGISFLDPPASNNNNNQVNTLGVGLQNVTNPIRISTTLIGITTGGNSAQAGIWFGYNEDNFVKLDVNNNNVELRREINGVSGDSDQLQDGGTGASGQNVLLELEIYPTNNTIAAFYTVGNGTRTQVGNSTLPLPANYLSGRNLTGVTGGVTFAGIFATHRAGTQFIATFDGFDLEEINQLPVIVDQSFSITEGSADNTVVGNVIATDDVAITGFEIIAGNGLGIFDIDNVGTLTVADNTNLLSANSPVVLTVEVTDGEETAEANISVTIIENTACNPISTLDCPDVIEAIPFSLGFSTDEGGLADKDGNGTGFTAVLEHSEARRAGDLPISNPDVNGYEPSLLTLNTGNGQLEILSQAGISFLDPPESLNNNNQVNTLGVGLQNVSSPIRLSTTLKGITTGGSSAQAGLWFGFDEDNFVKLNVNNNNVELRKEVGGASTNTGGNIDQFQDNGVGTSGQDVLLELEINPFNNTISGFYTIGTGARTQVGNAELDLPTSYLTGRSLTGVTGGVTFGGIYATHRNGTQFTAAFDDFSIETYQAPLPTLSFGTDPINVTLEEGDNQSTLTNELTASNAATPTATLTVQYTDGSGWLSVPATVDLSTDNPFDVTFDADGLLEGTYSATITATASNYTDATFDAQLTVSGAFTGVQVNFSDQGTPAPNGYVADFGQAFGDRGNGFTYGWLNEFGTAPQSLVGNGRNRGPNPDNNTLLETLMHMQYDDVDGNNGVLEEGIWEVEVPNGLYDVIVTAGDTDPENLPETRYVVNVEGLPAIDYVANQGASNSQVNTVTVNVTDGRITLDAKNGGFNTKLQTVIITPSTGTARPFVLAINPANGGILNDCNAGISTEQLILPNGRIDNSTLDGNVFLLIDGTNTQVAGTVNGTGGGDAITFVPNAPLISNTTYRFEINDGVLDITGESMIPFESTFTTGSCAVINPSDITFTKYQGVATGDGYTSLDIGPEGKLYGLTIGGEIHRWDMTGTTLSNKEVITTLVDARGARAAIGLVFEPTNDGSLIAWVTHSSGGLQNAPTWDGNLSRLTGDDLENEELVLTNLPRSIRDHLTNSLEFGPDGALYFNQGSNSAMGAPDGAWGNRPERLLSAAVLRLDIDLLPNNLPLDVQTVDGNGSYDPFAVNAPLTIFAEGIRNAYDLVWHTNGQLYIPTNGSAAGGNTPTSNPNDQNYIAPNPNYSYSGPTIPYIGGIQPTQFDYLFRVVANGYYGHPNPLRAKYVLNGGDADVNNAGYNGVAPDAGYLGFAYNFDRNKSPNGVIEYRSNAFGGALQGRILVVRYSQNDDIIVLEPGGSNLDIVNEIEGIPGFTGFSNPLDLIEDVSTGNIYVSEYGANRITLITPDQAPITESAIAVSPETVFINEVQDGAASGPQTVTITNIGSQELVISNIALGGVDAAVYSLDQTGIDLTLDPGQQTTFNVTFDPTEEGPQFANVTITSNASNDPSLEVLLNGLGTDGLGGSAEPSLQYVLDTYLGEGVIDVGDNDDATNVLHNSIKDGSLLGDEIDVETFKKAGDGNVEITLIGVFGPTSTNPIVKVGWYTAGDASSITELFNVDNTPTSNGQSLVPPVNGVLSFNPGDAQFGFYSEWPFFNNRQLFSQDALNTTTPDPSASGQHVRVYELPGEENAYVIATEEHTVGFDYQDVVFIARNIEPGFEPTGALVRIENLRKIPTTDIGFPAEDCFVFSRNNVAGNNIKSREENTMRIHNDGTGELFISSLVFSDPTEFDLPNNDEQSLPITIQPGQFHDMPIAFIKSTGNKGVYVQTLTIGSNADNEQSTTAELRGGYMQVSQGGNEINAQQVIDVFGFQTDMRTIVGDNDLTNPNRLLNTPSASPSSDFPLISDIEAGYHGDIVLSEFWERVDQSEPVRALFLGAYHGPGTAGAQTQGPGTDISITHDPQWFQTILPKLNNGANDDVLAYDGENLTGQFKLATAGQNTSGSNNGTLLGIRVYKVYDKEGNIIPYHYISVQDYIGNGCGQGSANCDWNDNLVYWTNIKPVADPSFNPIADAEVDAGVNFSFDINDSFDGGYPGNTFSYTASQENGDPLPSWIVFNEETGVFAGVAPFNQTEPIEITVEGTDCNGAVLSGDFTLTVNLGNISCTVDAGEDQFLSCNTTEVTLTGTTSTGTYTWEGPNGFIANTQSITVSEAGTYTLSVPAAGNEISINFQDGLSDDPAAPYLVDYGQAYANRTEARQGSGIYTYGWVVPGTSTPLDLSTGGNPPGNGRNRENGGDFLIETLMHMQYAGSNGVAAPGSWEIELPNGLYSVTVAGGDTDNESTEITRHVINAEGINLVDFFTFPEGGPGTSGNQVGAAIISVTDGKLTLDAIGGSNTKILYASIVEVSCPVTDEVVVTEEDILPVAEIASTTTVITCAEPEIELSGSSSTFEIGATFAWEAANGGVIVGSTVGETVTVSAAGMYTLTITNPSGCDDETSIVVTEDLTPASAGNGGQIAVCNDESSFNLFEALLTFGGDPEAGGSWTLGGNPVSATFNPSTDLGGDYIYSVGNSAVCAVATATLSISVEQPLSAGANTSAILCKVGGVVDLFTLLDNADQGGVWTFGGNPVSASFDPSADAEGDYTYTVGSGGTCGESSAIVSITVEENPSAGSDETVAVCEAEGVVDLFSFLDGASAGGSWTFGGSPVSASFDPASDPAGAYVYTVGGDNGCEESSSTLTISVDQQPSAGTSTSITLCETDDAVDLFVVLGDAEEGGSWNTGNGTFDPSTDIAGDYTYTVSGSGACSDPVSATVTVSVEAAPDAGTDGAVAVCTNDGIVDLFSLLGGTPDNGGVWSPALSGGAGLFNPAVDQPGVYTYTISGTACTDASASVTVTEKDDCQVQCISGIVSFTLVDPVSDNDIGPLVNGQVINIADLGANLNVRANSCGDVAKVVLTLEGAQNYSRTESKAPYALFGDSNGDYFSWVNNGATPGTYTLTAMPMDSDGDQGDVLSISFTVVDEVIIGNTQPIANSQSVTTPENTSVNITLTGSDADNDPLTYMVVGGPTKGQLSGTAPNLTYTPNQGATGSDSFTFKVNDGQEDSDLA
ncbi:MAG: Ig-like domain-containing protein, partial [Bacteroidota bacterium]